MFTGGGRFGYQYYTDTGLHHTKKLEHQHIISENSDYNTIGIIHFQRSLIHSRSLF